MFSYALSLAVLGFAVLIVAWLPSLLKVYPLSYPIVVVAIGLLAYVFPLPLPSPKPLDHPEVTTHLSELCIIIALTGTGLKIDLPFSPKTWVVPLRLVILTMPLSIALMALTAWAWLGLAPASALLIAASLAPTDPVLASDVQVGDPGEGQEDPVRLALTGEAGLNDGLAFPFIYGAIALLTTTGSFQEQLTHWFLFDLIYRVGWGLVGGWFSGKLLAWLIFRLPERIQIKTGVYGFVVLAVTLITYGTIELLHGYGFLAVFVAAVTFRSYERTHHYHQHMHDFSDQIERLFIVVLLLLFGGAINQELLAPLTWPDVGWGLFLLLVIRPLVGMVTLIGTNTTLKERFIIACFGIRGIGSFFYIAYGLEQANFPEAERLWAIIGFVVLVSIIVHGILATPVMKQLDTHYKRTRRRFV